MSFDLSSFKHGIGSFVNQVNDLKSKIEKQMEQALDEEDPNNKESEVPEVTDVTNNKINIMNKKRFASSVGIAPIATANLLDFKSGEKSPDSKANSFDFFSKAAANVVKQVSGISWNAANGFDEFNDDDLSLFSSESGPVAVEILDEDSNDLTATQTQMVTGFCKNAEDGNDLIRAALDIAHIENETRVLYYCFLATVGNINLATEKPHNLTNDLSLTAIGTNNSEAFKEIIGNDNLPLIARNDYVNAEITQKVMNASLSATALELKLCDENEKLINDNSLGTELDLASESLVVEDTPDRKDSSSPKLGQEKLLSSDDDGSHMANNDPIFSSPKRPCKTRDVNPAQSNSFQNEENKQSPDVDDLLDNVEKESLEKDSLINTLQHVVQQRELQLEKQVLRIVELEASVTALEASNQQIKHELSALQLKSLSVEKTESQSSNAIAAYKNEIHVLKAQLLESVAKVDGLMQEGLTLSKKNGELELKVRKIRGELNTEKTSTHELQKDIIGLKALLDNEKYAKRHLEEELITKDGHLADLKRKVNDLSDEIEQYTKARTEDSNERKRLLDQISAFQNEKKNLHEGFAAIESTLRNEIKNPRKKLESSSSRARSPMHLNRTESDQIALANELRSLQDQNVQVIQDLETLKEKHDSALLQSEEREIWFREQICRLESERDEQRQRALRLEAQLEGYTQEHDILSQQARSFELKLSQLQATADSNVMKRREMEMLLEDEKTALVTARKDLKGAQIQLLDKDQELLKLRQQINDLQIIHQEELDQLKNEPIRVQHDLKPLRRQSTRSSLGARSFSNDDLDVDASYPDLHTADTVNSSLESLLQRYSRSISTPSSLHLPMRAEHNIHQTELEMRDALIQSLQRDLADQNLIVSKLQAELSSKTIDEAYDERKEYEELLREKEERIDDLETEVRISKHSLMQQIEHLAQELAAIKNLEH